MARPGTGESGNGSTSSGDRCRSVPGRRRAASPEVPIALQQSGGKKQNRFVFVRVIHHVIARCETKQGLKRFPMRGCCQRPIYFAPFVGGHPRRKPLYQQ